MITRRRYRTPAQLKIASVTRKRSQRNPWQSRVFKVLIDGPDNFGVAAGRAEGVALRMWTAIRRSVN